MHFHTLGNRCHCGHLTIPVSFHSRDSEGNVISDGKGEIEYLKWLASDDKPDYVNPPVMEEIKRTKPEKELTDTNKRTRGRPRKWESDAARKASSRERKQDDVR